MQVNKNGIPVHTPRKQPYRERPDYKLEQIKYISIVNGYEVSIVIPNLSPLRKVARLSGWKKVKFKDR